MISADESRQVIDASLGYFSPMAFLNPSEKLNEFKMQLEQQLDKKIDSNSKAFFYAALSYDHIMAIGHAIKKIRDNNDVVNRDNLMQYLRSTDFNGLSGKVYIKKGTNDFSNLAVSQSQHEQSKSRGGYMGVMEVDGLLPEIKEHILKSKIGEVSDPIETDSGLHIIKRGTILAEETIVFEQVEDQIRQILIKQTGMQLKNAIFDQAREDYPQQISESIIEDWWLKLKDEINP